MTAGKALVLGATGAVGCPLALALNEAGYEVVGAARRCETDAAAPLREAGIELLRHDVTRDDPARLPEVDWLFLEVWDPSRPELVWPINFHGVGRVVERYAGRAGIVNGCTINVYGDAPEPSAEDTPCRPNSDYGRSRYAQERLIDYFCASRGGVGIHVRYAHANSARRGLVRRMAEQVLAGKSLGADPDALLQVIALEDFVRVTVAATARAACPPAAVNCCHPRLWTRRELALELERRLGRGEVVFDAPQGGRERSACASADRMCEWFGPPTVPLDEVLDRVVRELLQPPG